jgi:hypothetical protein
MGSLALVLFDQITLNDQLTQSNFDGIAIGLGDGLDLRDLCTAMFFNYFQNLDGKHRQCHYQTFAFNLYRKRV